MEKKYSQTPAFKPDDEDIGKPEPTPESDKIVKKMRKRQGDFLEHAKMCVPDMTERELEEMFSAVMETFHNQAFFRCIAVSPPAPDGACEISFHNQIPRLVNGVYRSEKAAVHGHFFITNLFYKSQFMLIIKQTYLTENNMPFLGVVLQL